MAVLAAAQHAKILSGSAAGMLDIFAICGPLTVWVQPRAGLGLCILGSSQFEQAVGVLAFRGPVELKHGGNIHLEAHPSSKWG